MKSLGKSVVSPISNTSFQLTLEHKNVRAAVANYSKPLAKLLQGKKNVIGLAIVINGKITSADVYASSALFKKLWPKLMNAAVIEAIAERKQNKFKPVTIKAVNAFLTEITARPVFVNEINNRIKVGERESDGAVLFETRDRARRQLVIHRSYLAK
jgi:hypothetical protein